MVPLLAADCGMDNDSYYVDPSLDTKEIRTFLVVKACLLHDQCSKASWGRVHSRSQDGDRIKQVVKSQMMESSNHYCEAAAADDLVNFAMERDLEEET